MERFELTDDDVYELAGPARLHRPVPDRGPRHAGAARPALDAASPRASPMRMPISSPRSRRATSSSTIPTRASTRASSTSSAMRPTIPDTLAIKMTVYRVGDDTPFVRSLIRAAEAGKQVACVIELRRASTKRATCTGRRSWRRSARTSPTASSASRPTPRSRWSSARRARTALLRAHRHRQLSRQDRPALHRRRPAHLRPGAHRRCRQPVSLPHRPLEGAAVPEAAGRADQHAPALSRDDRARNRASSRRAGRRASSPR